ncbi:MAG: metallophosphoesterase [Rhizobiales bacterium]|nr:metallophosphoesterase [Hyphomicrobiales bacterium]
MQPKPTTKTQPKPNTRRATRDAPASALAAIALMLRRTNMALFAVAGLLMLLIAAFIALHSIGDNAAGDRSSQQSARRLTFLAINDVYRLQGVAEGKSGGLTRLRTLRKWIERDAPNAILLHAGDFLSPSLTSREFKGASMIDIMNRLDGEPDGFDSRMFVTFGNHEFDISKCSDADPPLNARVAESQFMWLAANLDFSRCAGMRDMPERKNVIRDGVVIEVDKIKLGLFGLGQTPDQVGAPVYPNNEKALPAARRSIAYLRERGAEVIVALTHLSRAEDEELIRQLSGSGLDLVVGGHDHTNMVLLDADGKVRGVKADSDARTAWRIDVQVPAGGRPRVDAQLIALNQAIPPDPALAKVAQDWSARAERQICAARGSAKADCLDEPIGRTQTVIELEEEANRSKETGFGDWLADLVAEKTGADVVLINSGILGLNEDLAPGSRLVLRHVVDIFRFNDVVAVESFPAKVVCEAIKHGFKTPGMGAWPHISGLDVEVTRRAGGNEAAVKGFRRKPGVTCADETPVNVATVPYLLCSNDGYKFLPASKSCIADLGSKARAEGGRLLGDIAEAAIRAAGNAGIKPKTDGRLQFIDAK